MTSQALFAGLVVDEYENPVDSKRVGDEAFYVVNDDGFLRHIESKIVDRQVLEQMQEMIEQNEDLVSEGTMRMIGQEDIFTKAAIESSLKDAESQIDQVLTAGLPEDARMWLGMVGLRATIDIHGTVVHIEQPSAPEEPWDE